MEESFEGEDLLRALNTDGEEEQTYAADSYAQLATQSIQEMNEWKEAARLRLSQFQSSLGQTPDTVITIAEQAENISIAARFDGDKELDTFMDEETYQMSRECLAALSSRKAFQTTKRDVISLVLTSHIKPLFLSTPHPSVSLQSGRRLPRQAGGRHGAEDLYDDQVWKSTGRGCWNTVWWCIRYLEPDDFPLLWPALIPPIMTMMDDYEPEYKIRAIRIVKDLIQKVDADLLKRTGLGQLLDNSLSVALTYFTSDHTAILLPLAISCSHQLIEKVTPPQSMERHDRLWNLVSTSIVGGAWLYGGKHIATMEAALEGLVPLIDLLGLGCVRFLKAFMPQLTHDLVAQPFHTPSPKLQCLSAQALVSLIRSCGPRIREAWRDQLLVGALRAWVQNEEEGKDQPVRENLQKLFAELCVLDPSIQTNVYSILLERDRVMFQGLLQPNN